MTRIIIIIAISVIASQWLQPLTSTILNAKGSFIFFFLNAGLPIGWLGFTAIFSAVGFAIVFGFLQLFK